jgi:hypothetical protein
MTPPTVGGFTDVVKSITLIDPGCPDNSQREGTIVFNFSDPRVPSLVNRPPPEREAKTARVNKSPGFLLLSSINRDIPVSRIRAVRSENRKENEERRKKDSGRPLPTCSRLTSASRTRPWLASGWGCRGRRPSRGRRNPGTQPSLWWCHQIPHTPCPVLSAPVRPWCSSR